MKERIANFINEYAKANSGIRQPTQIGTWLESIDYFNVRVDYLMTPVLDGNLGIASETMLNHLKSSIYYPIHAVPGISFGASEVNLSFCLWMSTWGEVFSLNGHFYEGKFTWHGTLLERLIGQFYMPR